MVKKKLAYLCIAIGLLFILTPAFLLIRSQQQQQVALTEWSLNQIPMHERKTFNTITYTTHIEPSSIIGTVTLPLMTNPLPLIEGITLNDLTRGIGHDSSTVLPGEIGNSLLYGHREQFLWTLKDIQIGQIIQLETQVGVLSFKVSDFFIVEPTDAKIFQSTTKPTITLVTCYPFIYFGPTEKRFVVKATLLQ